MENYYSMNYSGEKMKDLGQKILESEYKRRKMFPLIENDGEKEYLEKLRFHINLKANKTDTI